MHSLTMSLDFQGEREVLTEGKMLLLALETGMFQGHGLHSREKVCILSSLCASLLLVSLYFKY